MWTQFPFNTQTKSAKSNPNNRSCPRVEILILMNFVKLLMTFPFGMTFIHSNVSSFENMFFFLQKIQAEEALYDASLLAKLDFSRSITKFDPPISAVNTGEPWLKVRPLQVGDYDRGFLQLLSQLTSVGNVSRLDFLSMQQKFIYFIFSTFFYY